MVSIVVAIAIAILLALAVFVIMLFRFGSRRSSGIRSLAARFACVLLLLPVASCGLRKTEGEGGSPDERSGTRRR